jgi:hypothetical protein
MHTSCFGSNCASADSDSRFPGRDNGEEDAIANVISGRRQARVSGTLKRPVSPPLLPCEGHRQIPEFGFHFGGIGHSIRDFLAQQVAIPLAKPVNGHLERSF